MADAFHSELVSASRRGEAFGVESGRPVSMERAQRRVSWLAFAREYAVMKWPHLAPNSWRNTARALTNATLALLTSDRGRPPDPDLRKALTAWSFNLRTSGSGSPPARRCPTAVGAGRSASASQVPRGPGGGGAAADRRGARWRRCVELQRVFSAATWCVPACAGQGRTPKITRRARQERVDAGQRRVEGCASRCPRWGSNPHWDPFKGPASAGWATGAEWRV